MIREQRKYTIGSENGHFNQKVVKFSYDYPTESNKIVDIKYRVYLQIA